MFNVKVLKAPTRKTSDVLNVFQKTLDDLDQVATQHDEYAVKQKEIAAAAQREADAAELEANEARVSIEALNKALGRN